MNLAAIAADNGLVTVLIVLAILALLIWIVRR